MSIEIHTEGRTRLYCAACRAQYDFPFRLGMPVDEPGSFADISRAKVEILTFQQGRHRYRSCPACGKLPVRRLGEMRLPLELLLGLCGFSAVAILSVYCAAMPLYDNDTRMVLQGVLGIAVAQTVGHCAVVTFIRASSTRAQRKKTATMPFERVAAPEPSLFDHYHWPKRRFGVPLLLAAISLPLAPLGFLETKSEFVNEGVSPAIIGPGDTAKLQLNQRLHSMNQVWWGEVAVHVENSTELGLKQAEIDASAPDESNIARRQFNTNDREWPFRPVIGIELPQTYSLENSTLVLILRVRATVAKRHPFSYEMVPAPEVYERRPIRVASRADSQIYRLLFAMALIGPTLALGGTGLLHWRCNLRLQNGPKPDVQILASARVESAPDSRGHFSWKEFRAGQSIEFDA